MQETTINRSSIMARASSTEASTWRGESTLLLLVVVDVDGNVCPCCQAVVAATPALPTNVKVVKRLRLSNGIESSEEEEEDVVSARSSMEQCFVGSTFVLGEQNPRLTPARPNNSKDAKSSTTLLG